MLNCQKTNLKRWPFIVHLQNNEIGGREHINGCEELEVKAGMIEGVYEDSAMSRLYLDCDSRCMSLHMW